MSNILMIEVGNDNQSKGKEGIRKKKRTGRSKRRLREPKIIVQREVVEILAADTDSCTSIWQSVVVQAFYDLLSESQAFEQKLERANAMAWFGQGVAAKNSEPTDFQMVCELAELDPYALIKLARKVIRGDGKEVRQQIVSGFNFRTLRRDSSNRTPKKIKAKMED